jgi:hypothetical protein
MRSVSECCTGSVRISIYVTPLLVTPVFVAARESHVECIRVLHELGADVNFIDNCFSSLLRSAVVEDHAECVRMLVHLGADVEELLKYLDETADVTRIVNNIHAFLAATKLNTSHHQYALYSITQLAAYYVQRRQYPGQ